MSLALLYDKRFLDHPTGRAHPERPERLAAIIARLQSSGLWDQLVHLSFEPAPRACLERVHQQAYIDRLVNACAAGKKTIDCADSCIGSASESIARLAAGAAITAADAVATGMVDRAFAAVRPPGHHAEPGESMGFCLYNNIAIAAEHLIKKHGVKRLAIVDFDVHHGNGTQHHFESRGDVLFISIHQHPGTLYPGTGYGNETGQGAGQDATLNLLLMPGADDTAYLDVLNKQVTDALARFTPEILLVSAGFDAAADDPLAQMNVTTSGFQAIASYLKAQAQTWCGGRIVTCLEGGYDLTALSEGVEAYLEVMLGD